MYCFDGCVLEVRCTFVPGVCAVNNLIYVIGGDDGSCNLASVEFYNPNTDKWTLLATCMSTGRSYAGQNISYYHITVVFRIVIFSDFRIFGPCWDPPRKLNKFYLFSFLAGLGMCAW